MARCAILLKKIFNRVGRYASECRVNGELSHGRKGFLPAIYHPHPTVTKVAFQHKPPVAEDVKSVMGGFCL